MGSGKLLIVFGAQNLVDLMVHYSEGKIPLGAKLVSIGTSPTLYRHIGLEIESDQWEDAPIAYETLQDKTQLGGLSPVHFRYEGKKTLTWSSTPNAETGPTWKDADNFEGQRVKGRR